MKTTYLTSLMVLVMTAACSGAHTTDGGGGQTQAQLKKTAAEAAASGSASGDVCGDNDWYGDGECDTFCRDTDATDCAPDCGGGVICAAFIEEANGYCSRLPEDPCIGQDPDCMGGSEPPTNPDDPIACPAIAELPDGVCDGDPANPCSILADPDCQTTIEPDPGMGGGGSDPGMGGGTPSDPGVACAEYIEVPDGVCSRDPNDPCIFQDPDCNAQ